MQIGVRVPAELRTKLDALADQNGRSITDEIREALEKHVDRPAKKARK
jgi:predicted DNA-binding protein